MNHDEITAEEFARRHGIDAKALRAKLREAFPEHSKFDRWIVIPGTPDHDKWLALAAELKR
jgi:hypothetical protein